MPDSTLLRLIVDYVLATIAYWWLLVPGALMPLPEIVKALHPKGKDFPIPWWLRMSILLGCFTVAQFLAYKDVRRNLAQVIEEKRQQSITINSLRDTTQNQDSQMSVLKQHVKDLEQAGPRTITRTLPAPEPEQRCWLSNHFGMPNSTIKGAVTASAVIIHCNHKVDAPYIVQVEFDRDFIPGAAIPLDSGVVMSAGEGKRGRVYMAQINSPALLSDQVFVVTVYGDTDQYPRAVKGSVQAMK